MGFFKIKKIIILKTIVIFILSLVPIIWIIQKNPNVQKRITEKLIDILQQEWDAKITVKSYDINFFTGKIYLNNGKVSSFKESLKTFYWNFEEAKISFSRLDYFFKDYFSMDVVFESVDAKTSVNNGKLDISKHLEKIVLQNSTIGGQLRSVKVSNFAFVVDYGDKEFLIKLQGRFGLKKFGNLLIGRHWSGFLFLDDGQIVVNKKILVKDLKINSIFSEKGFFSAGFNQSTNGSFVFLENDYSIIGLNSNINIRDLFEVDNFNLDFNFSNDLILKGNNKIDLFNQINDFFANKKLNKNSIDGDCKFNLKFSSIDSSGDIILSNFSLPLLKESRWHGVINFSDLKNKKNFCLKNLDKVRFFDSWVVNTSDFNLDLNFDKDFNFSGRYTIKGGKNTLQNRHFLCSGNCFFRNNNFKTYGFINKDYFGIDLSLKPFFHFNKILYAKGNRKLINFNLKKDKELGLFGDIDFSFFRFFFPYSLKRYILGKNAKFCLSVDQANPDHILGHAFLRGGKLSLLKSYNSVENFKFNFLFDKSFKKLYLNNFLMTFFRGYLFSSKIELGFDDNFNINFLDLPLSIKNLLINWKKDFYALLNGNLLLGQKNKKVTDLTGNLVLKKSLFKENLFGFDNKDVTNLSFLIHPLSLDENIINLNLNFTNLMPIKIETGFANLDVNSDLNLELTLANGHFFNPKIIGSLFIEKGILDFLQHKLFIYYGKIQFIPNRLNDPIIDLVAKNKINKYLISLHATGSLNNPKIILESSPKLKKKQILALLVAGSPNASLKSQFSQILQRNLSNLNSKNSFLRKLMQPFRFVQITPTFSNQAGKSGLKGSIDIDLNNQIHTRLQKNFNLHDDLSFQMDYFVTDDVNVQFLKDQRGELGAQVEVRLTV